MVQLQHVVDVLMCHRALSVDDTQLSSEQREELLLLTAYVVHKVGAAGKGLHLEWRLPLVSFLSSFKRTASAKVSFLSLVTRP